MFRNVKLAASRYPIRNISYSRGLSMTAFSSIVRRINNTAITKPLASSSTPKITINTQHKHSLICGCKFFSSVPQSTGNIVAPVNETVKPPQQQQQPPFYPATSPFEDLLVLSKFSLSTLNAAVAAASFLVFVPCDITNAMGVFLGSFFMASSSQMMNQSLEKELDSAMPRTRHRPIPSGRVSPSTAIAASAVFGTSGAALLGAVNPLAAVVGAATWIGYITLYTPAKRTTHLNTHLGAVVGAMVPLIGYTSAMGTSISGAALTLAPVLYAWQLPHFYGLAWSFASDYANAGFKVLPNYDPEGESSYLQMTIGNTVIASWSVALYAAQFAPYVLPLAIVPASIALQYKVQRFFYAGSKQGRGKVGHEIFLYSNMLMIYILIVYVICCSTNDKNVKPVQSAFRDYLIQFDSVIAAEKMFAEKSNATFDNRDELVALCTSTLKSIFIPVAPVPTSSPVSPVSPVSPASSSSSSSSSSPSSPKH